jgi:20S proteasome subunit beta 1
MSICCSVEIDDEPLVKTAASIFKEFCYNNREQLSAGIICAGWDKRKGGQVQSFRPPPLTCSGLR